MALSWDEVIDSPAFQQLPPDQKDQAKAQYFMQQVAPRLPAQAQGEAWQQFSSYRPDHQPVVSGAQRAGGLAVSGAEGLLQLGKDVTINVADAAGRVARAVTAPSVAIPSNAGTAPSLAAGAEGGVFDPELQAESERATTAAPVGVTVPNPVGQAYEATGLPRPVPIKDQAWYDDAGIDDNIRRSTEALDSLKPDAVRAQAARAAQESGSADGQGIIPEIVAATKSAAKYPGNTLDIVAQSAPSFIAPGKAAQGAEALVAEKIMAVAKKAGLNPDLARVVAERAGQRAATATSAAVATGQSAEQTADQAAQAIDDTPDADLVAHSPKLAAAVKQGRTAAERAQIIADAREEMKAVARQVAFTDASLTTGLSSVASGSAAFEAKLFRQAEGQPLRNAVKEFGEGLAKEGGQEFFESGGEQFAQNEGEIQSGANPNKDPFEGVGSQATTGGLTGGLQGAGAGGVHGLLSARPSRGQPQAEPQDNAAPPPGSSGANPSGPGATGPAADDLNVSPAAADAAFEDGGAPRALPPPAAPAVAATATPSAPAPVTPAAAEAPATVAAPATAPEPATVAAPATPAAPITPPAAAAPATPAAPAPAAPAPSAPAAPAPLSEKAQAERARREKLRAEKLSALKPTPEKDDLITFLRKHGGINVDAPGGEEIRGRLNHLDRTGPTIFGLAGIERKGTDKRTGKIRGLTLEEAAELATDAGYIEPSAHGYDQSALLDKLSDAESGQKIYSQRNQTHVQDAIDAQLAEDAGREADRRQRESAPDFDPFAPENVTSGHIDDALSSFGLEDTPENRVDTGLVGHATDILGPDAVEDLARKHPADEAFHAALQEAIDGRKAEEAAAGRADDRAPDAEGARRPDANQRAGGTETARQEAGPQAEGLTLQAQQAPTPEPKPEPKAPPTDLLGTVPVAQQAIADRQREQDGKRNGTKDVPAGLDGGLFSDRQKQTDIADAPAPITTPGTRVSFDNVAGWIKGHKEIDARAPSATRHKQLAAHIAALSDDVIARETDRDALKSLNLYFRAHPQLKPPRGKREGSDYERVINAVDRRIKALDGEKPKSQAPEHANIDEGVTDKELNKLAQEFSDAQAAALEDPDRITHIFDPPAKKDIVRLQDKVRVYNEKHGWMTPAEARKQIDAWEDHAVEQGRNDESRHLNSQKIVLSLFDKSGMWSMPWEQAGYQVYRFDIQDDSTYEDPETGEERKIGDINNMSVEFFNDLFGSFDGLDVHAILAACPCTDFAVSGARHFAAKDADGRTHSSVKLVHQTLAAIEYFKPSVWAIENPVGRIEKLGGLPPWRLSFDPNHLGDPYTKKTLLWGRFNGDLPIAPVEPTEGSKMHTRYGGSSIATKNARSVTPEGFAYSFFMANNAIDHPLMTLANKYDRLDRDAIKGALDAGLTPAQIDTLVEEHYYQELDDDAANQALRDAAQNRAPNGADKFIGYAKDYNESADKLEGKPAGTWLIQHDAGDLVRSASSLFNVMFATPNGGIAGGDTATSEIEAIRRGQKRADDFGLRLRDKLNSAESAPRTNEGSNAEKPADAGPKASENAEPKAKPSGNKVFTDDAAAAARERLRAKLGRPNSGIDPEMLLDGVTLAGWHIERGARTFAAFAKAMVEDLGEAVRPYLKSWYMGVKYDPRATSLEGMDAADVVEKADAQTIGKDTPARGGALEEHFMQRVRERLQGDGFATIAQARALYADVIGRKAEGAELKRVDELVEQAVVAQARELAAGAASPDEAYQALVDLYQRQPRLGTRTSTSVENQAYSTPAPLAYLASRLAGITRESKVLEPTAGTGMLLIEANPANTTANEINDDRAEALRAQGFRVSQKDAATENLRHKGYPVDVVIENPPFGTVKDERGNSKSFDAGGFYQTTEIDHAIVLNTLPSMKDDGRAVLIVGGINKQLRDEAARSDAYNGAAKRKFYYHLYQNYNVTDHFTVAGELYERQGAGWPVDVIVIQGKGKSSLSLPAVAVPPVYTNWTQLQEKLNDANRVVPRQEPDADPAGRGDAGSDAAAGSPDLSRGSGVSTGRNGDDAGQGGRARSGTAPGRPGAVERVGERDAGQLRQRAGDEQSPAVGPAGRPAAAEESQGPDAGGNAGGEAGTRGGQGGPAAAAGSLDRRASPPSVTPTATQVAYTPASQAGAIGTLVPVNMQTAIANALAALEQRVGPVNDYIAKELGYDAAEVGRYFSAEQIDALGLALDQMQRGRGFIIGDQTGIGKGRVVAGVIRHALRNGRIPVFVTEKPNLYADIYRDLNDIGVTEIRPLMTNGDQTINLDDEGNVQLKTPASGKHNADLLRMAGDGSLGVHNMVFTTYSQMQTLKGQPTPRMQFLEAIAPNAIVIMDESHNAGGNDAGRQNNRQKEENAGSGKTGRAAFARKLIGLAQGAFYSSATYAKRPSVMDLYFKTDMALAVDNDPTKLPGAIAAGGVPLQQVVASMLAKAGQYIRRERSFAGVEYNTPVVPVDRAAAEQIASIMLGIHQFDETKAGAIEALKKQAKSEAASVSFDGSTGAAGAQSTNFTALMHNVIDQMLLGLKVADTARRAIESVQRGERVVITVANTMGSFIDEYAKEVGVNPGDAINLSFADVLSRYLERSRDVTIKDVSGKSKRHRLTDEELGAAGRAAYRRVTKLIDGASMLTSVPVSPIDYLHAKLREAGIQSGEITGRSATIDYTGDQPRFRVRPTKEVSINGRRKAISAFNNGPMQAIILNQAGSTGLSLHASEKFKNRERRRMLIAQAEKNIDTHMQMLGRVHRTGQVIEPVYDQLVADVPAEKRPAAVLAKKMASLNASTTASRGSALTSKEVVDFLNEYGDEVVAQLMADMPDVHEKLGDPLDQTEDGFDKSEAARKVTGRIPMLPVADQESLYDMIEGAYRDRLARAEAMGENALEASTLDLDAQPKQELPLFEGKGGSSSPFAEGARAVLASVKRIGKPMTSAQVLDLLREQFGEGGDATLRQLQASGSKRWQETLQKTAAEAKDLREAALRKMMADEVEQKNIDGRLAILDGNLSKWTAIAHRITPGATYRLTLPDGTRLYGVATDISRRKGVKNPVAMGSWNVQFAVADGIRSITFPMSKLTVGGGEGLTLIEPVTTDTLNTPVLDLFDAGQSQSREDRVLANGNLLAAYATLKGGRIVNYTDDKGRITQGILMPRTFDLKDFADTRPIEIKPEQAQRFFQLAPNGELRSTDGRVQIVTRGNNYLLVVPKSKAEGGDYFLNQKLRAVVGDFVASGSIMRATAEGPGKLVEAMRVLERELDQKFATTTYRAEAKQAGGVSPTIGDAKDAPVDFSRSGRAEGRTATAEEVQRAERLVAEAARDWAQKPRIVVLSSMQDARAPQAARDADDRAMNNGAKGSPLGFIYRGVVYINAGAARSPTTQIRTLFHEALGHYGLRGVFGATLDNELRKVALLNAKQISAKLVEYGMSDTPANRLRAAEEVLARKAETEPNDPLVQRVLAAIRSFLRKILDKLGIKLALSDAELVRDYIKPARDWVRNGVAGARSQAQNRGNEYADANRPVSQTARENDAGPEAGASAGSSEVSSGPTETALVTNGTRALGAKSVKNWSDAVQALASIGSKAVEHLEILVTDKNGKPLAVIGNFKGARAAAPAYVSTIVSEVYGIEGAAHLWMVHNHPSGKPDLSLADMRLGDAVAEAFRGTRLMVRGIAAVGAGDGTTRRWTAAEPRNSAQHAGDVPTGGATELSVPTVERQFTRTGKLGPQIGSAADAKTAVRNIAGARPGVVLLDAQQNPIGFLPVTPERAGQLRDTGGLDALYEAAARSNADSAIIANPDGAYTPKQLANLGGALQNGGAEIRVLDAINYSSDSYVPAVSLAERGQDITSNPFFARGYHGTPHAVDRFDSAKIGSGEGAQAYGHGLYFADNEAVADQYRKTLSYRDLVNQFRDAMPDDADTDEALAWANSGEAPPKMARVIKALAADDWLGFDYPAQALTALFKAPENYETSQALNDAADAMRGNLYTVEIPDEHIARMLDWDKPLSEQPDSVLSALSKETGVSIDNYRQSSKTGKQMYQTFVSRRGSAEQASARLAEIGIPGIRYDDAGSRPNSWNWLGGLPPDHKVTRNTVVFDDSIVKITHRNGTPVTAAERRDALAEHDPSSVAFDRTQQNGSGESAASLEAQSRLQDARARGRQTVRVDRTGEVTPIRGVSTADTKAYAGQVLLQKNVGADTWTVMDQGPGTTAGDVARARAKADEHAREVEPMFNRRPTTEVMAEAVQKVGAEKFQQYVEEHLAQFDQEEMEPAEIAAEIEGVARNVVDGAYDAAPQVETPAFKAWFGNSKVVDADGKPKVVYHGTTRWSNNGIEFGDVQTFDRQFTKKALGRQKTIDHVGTWFSDRPDEQGAGAFAFGAMYPVYLSIKNPWRPREGFKTLKRVAAKLSGVDPDSIKGPLDAEPMRQWLLDGGYDGIAFPRGTVDGLDTEVYVALHPEQIKSAIGNNGNFDPNDDRIDFNRGEDETGWQIDAPTRKDDLIYALQNKHVDLRRLIDTISKAGKEIDDHYDPSLKEELYSSRAMFQTKAFAADEVSPLLKQMAVAKVSLDELGHYLHARHAEEANRRIAEINPDSPGLQDGGSGMTTQAARDYLEGLSDADRRKYQALAERIDKIIAGTRQYLVDAGLETPATIRAWAETYKHYVPLMRDGFSKTGNGTGQGFSVRGSATKARLGSKRQVIDVVANVIMQRERAITRAEKNRVAKAMVGLAIKNPNPKLWLPVNPATEQRTPEQQAQLERQLIALGLDPIDARGVAREPVQRYLDPVTGLVAERINPALRGRENVLAARVKGKDWYLFINEHDERALRMVRALKNLDADQLSGLLRVLSSVTRYFASINTQYNPIFGVVNLVRDTQDALLNLSSTAVAGRQTEVLRESARLLAKIARAGFRLDKLQGEDAQLWEDFERAGGPTGYRDMFATSSDRAEALRKELDPAHWTTSTLGRVFTANGTLKVPLVQAQKLLAPLFDWLSDYNEALENVTRLAAFSVARRAGLSSERAASLAKNLTVNFNRKGQAATQIGALYAFFNASVQGTARLGQTLRGPAGKKIILGGLLLGALQALLFAAAGYDDQQPPEWIRERNLILPLGRGGKYLSLPLPLGFLVIPNLGRITTEFAISGGKDGARRVGDFLGLMADAFNPIGNAGLTMQTVAPTALDPIAGLLENKDFTGKPIARQDFNSLDPTPGFTRGRNGASAFGEAVAKALNYLSGGTEYQPGALSPTPDQIDYLAGQVTGGVGREVLKAGDVAKSALTGEDLPSYKVPLAGRFYGNTKEKASDMARFYDNVQKANLAANQVLGLARDQKPAERDAYLREHPEAAFAKDGNKLVSDLSQIRREKERLAKQGASRDQVQVLEDRMNAAVNAFNTKIAKATGAQPAAVK